MNNPLLLFTAPVGTRSGYGHHSRDIVKCLIDMNRFDIHIMDLRWGDTPRNALKTDNPDHIPIIERILKTNQLQRQPDIHVHLTVPNEYQPIAKYNIGITAGIETTLCSSEWIQGLNRMNLNIVPSTHVKDVFLKSTWTEREQLTNRPIRQLKLERPVEVLFEGADTSVYHRMSKTDDYPKMVVDEIRNIKTTFNFLFVGHWLRGDLGQDRKDVGMLVKVFFETFKNQKNPPGLILKTSGAGFSVMDREEIVNRIKILKNMSGNNNLPPVYLLHGDLTDEEMNALYNHPKVKAHITFTKGEGFCVKNYTKIRTNNGLKRIDEISIGDKVLSHVGKYQKVNDVMKRHYNGKMYNIIPHNLYPGEDIFLTPNHNIQIYDKKQNKFEWKSAEKISTKDYVCIPIEKDTQKIRYINIMDFVENYEVKVNQFSHPQKALLLENNIIKYSHSDKTKKIHEIPNTINLDYYFGKIVGYYLSEGCVSKDEIIFSLHTKERNTLGSEIIEGMEHVFGLKTYRIVDHYPKKCITIHFHSKIVSKFMSNICGKKRKKYINNVFLKSTKEFQTNMITSLIAGDGHINHEGIDISLVSKYILRTLRYMLFRYGILSHYQVHNRKGFNGDVHKLRISNKDSYNIFIKFFNLNHSFYNFKEREIKRKNYIGGRSPFIVDDKIIFPIREIKTEYYNGIVYNISVENDESYCLENFVVHNCRPLLEASLSAKPVIASEYSGYLDFLNKPFATLLPGQLMNVHKSAAWEKVILRESQWFTVNYNYASAVMKDVFKNYQKYELNAKKLAEINKSKFSREKMKQEFEKILNKYLPEFPKETMLSLPNLPQLKKKDGSVSISLPILGTGNPDLKNVSLPRLKLVAEEANHGSTEKPKDNFPIIKLPKFNTSVSQPDEPENDNIENSKN